MVWLASHDLAIFLLGSGLAFAWFWRTAHRLQGTGSDNAFYLYYIDCIRENGRRFLATFPNVPYEMATLSPQYLYWLMSFLKTRGQVLTLARVLNPILAMVNPVVIYGVVRGRLGPVPGAVPAGLVALLLVLTPVHFHGGNPKLHGLNGRGLGASLFFLATLVAWQIQVAGPRPGLVAAGAVLCWLLIGSSLFGMQALALLSVLQALVFHAFGLLGIGLAGTALFLACHPRHSLRYFRGVGKFWVIYLTFFTYHFLLPSHRGLWRDLAWDLWCRMRHSPRKAIAYAYTNNLLILALLNPLAPLVAAGFLGGATTAEDGALLTFSIHMTVTACLGFLATTFRWTRFLGEPERYVEFVQPHVVLAGAVLVHRWAGSAGLAGLALYSLAMAAGQTQMLRRVNGEAEARVKAMVREVTVQVDQAFPGRQARFISNNGQWGKLLLNTRWCHVFYWPTVRNVGGVELKDFWDQEPYIKNEAVLRLIGNCRLNVFLIDKALWGGPFQPGFEIRTLGETAAYGLYAAAGAGPGRGA